MKNRTLTAALAALLAFAGGGSPARAVEEASLGNAQVTLPYSELQRLQKELDETKRALAAALHAGPAGEVDISSARYEAGLRPGGLEIQATLRVVARGTGSSEVALFGEDVVVAEAQCPNSTALVAGRNGGTRLRVSAAGTYEVKLRLSVLSQENRVSFALPRAGAAQIRLTLPGAQASATITPSGGVSRRVEAGMTILEAALPPAEEITIEWSAVGGSEAAPAAGPGKVYLESLTAVTVEREVLRGATKLSYDVKGGVASEFAVALPEGARVVEATGAAQDKWDMKDGRLVIRANAPVGGRADFRVIWEAPLAADRLAAEIPRLRGVGAEREVGILGVAAGDGVEVEAGAEGPMTPLDPRSAPEGLAELSARPLVFAARFTGTEGKVAVQIKRLEAVAVVAARIERLAGHEVVLPTGRRVTLLSGQVRNSTVEYLDIRLPGGAKVWGASVGNNIVRPLRGATEGEIRLPLERSGAPEAGGSVFPFEVVYAEEDDALRTLARTISAPPVFSLDIGRLSWGIHLPEGSRKICARAGDWEKGDPEGDFAAGEGGARLGFPSSALEGPFVSFARHSLDAGAQASPVKIYFATASLGRGIGILVLLAALALAARAFAAGEIDRPERWGAIATIVVAILQEIAFDGGVRRLVQGILLGALLAGARRILSEKETARAQEPPRA